MNITRFHNVLGWLLVALAVLVFTSAVVVALRIPNEAITAWKEPVALASSTLLPAGLLATLGGLFLSKSREAGEAEKTRSLFYLQSCDRAYEEAWALLSDGNNERIKWIAAARALAHANDLSADVTSEAHSKVLEL